MLVGHRAGAQIMSLVLHGCDLVPFVLANVVLLDRAETLLTRETAENEDAAFANGNGVSVSTLGHLSLVQDLILLGQIDPRILLRRGASTCNENLGWAKSN